MVTRWTPSRLAVASTITYFLSPLVVALLIPTQDLTRFVPRLQFASKLLRQRSARPQSFFSYSMARTQQATEARNLAGESGKPAKGLSRRLMLGGLAILPVALPAAVDAAADPI